MNRWTAAAFIALGLVLGASGFVAAQAVLPTPTKGSTGEKLGRVDLGKAFPAMQGYELRLSRIVLEPGAGLPPHSHKLMPEVVYIVSGQLAEQINGGPIETYGAGKALVYDQSVLSHAEDNLGTERAVYIGAHVSPIPPPKPQ
jgi:redox-sensitive bicupin YhaK (pirin superfamily)